MAYEILKVASDLITTGHREARAEFSKTKKSAEGLVTTLQKMDKAGGSFVHLRDGLGKLQKAIQNTRAEAAKGADFEVRVDDSALKKVSRYFTTVRTNASKGADFEVRAEVSGLEVAKTAITAIREDARNGATIHVDADTGALATGWAAVQAFATQVGSLSPTVNVNATQSGFSGVLATIQALDTFARDVDNRWGNSIRVHSISTGHTEVLAQLQRIDAAADSIDGGEVKLTTTLAGAAAVMDDLQGMDNLAVSINGDQVVITTQVNGTEQGRANLASLESVAGRIDGRTLSMSTEVRGTTEAITELSALGQSVDRLDGRSININTSGAVVNINALAGSIRSLILVAQAASIPFLITAIAGIIPVAAGALGAVGALAVGIGSGLAGATMAGAGAMGILGASLGLIGGPIVALIAKLKGYGEGLKTAEAAGKAAGQASKQYQAALDNLADAQAGVGEATAQASEKVTSAVEAYASALEGVQSAEDAADDARGGLRDATEALADAQEDLNEAIRDEPLNQAESWLDRAEAALGVADATDRVTDAQDKLNEARASGDPEKIADAERDLTRAQLGTERSAIALKKANNEYHDTAVNGSKNLQSAQKGVESASKAEEKARESVADAEKNVDKARKEADKAYAGIAKAQADGAKMIADANEKVQKAQDQVNEAILAMAEASDKAAKAQGNLSAIQQALYDRAMQFKADAGTTFAPAMDSAAGLGIRILDLADNYFPRLGVSSLAAMEALGLAFDQFAVKLQAPIPDTAIQTILDYVPEATFLASSAVGNLGIALVTALGAAAPYGMALIESFSILTERFQAWITSAEGLNSMNESFALLFQSAGVLWEIMEDLAVTVWNLVGALEASGMVDFVMQGFAALAENLRAVTTEGTAARDTLETFFTQIQPTLSALWEATMLWVAAIGDLAVSVLAVKDEGSGLTVLEGILVAIGEAAGPVAAGFQAMFEHLGPVLPDLIINIAELFRILSENASPIAMLVEGFNWLMDVFNGLPEPIQAAVVQLGALSWIFGTLTGGSLTGVALGLAGIFTQLSLIAAVRGISVFALLGGYLTSIGSAIMFVLAPIGTFFSALLALNPVTWAIVAAVAAVAAAAYLIYQNWETIGPWLSELWLNIQEIFWNAITAIVARLMQWGQEIWQAIQPTLEQLRALWEEYWPGIRDTVTAVWDEIYAAIMGAVTTIWTFLQDTWGQVVAWWQEMMGQMGDGTATDWQGIADTIVSTVEWILSAIQTTLDILVAIWEAVWPGFKTVVSGVWMAISSLVEGALQVVLGIIQTVLGVITGDWEMAWSGLQRILGGVWTAISGVVEGAFWVVVGILQEGLGLIKLAWSALWDWIGPYVTGAFEAVMAAITWAGEQLMIAWTWITETATAAWNAIVAAITAVFGAIWTWLQPYVQAIIDGLAAAWTWITEAATVAWNFLVEAIRLVFFTLLGLVILIAQQIFEGLTAAWDMIVLGAQTAWDALVFVVTSVFGAIWGILQPIVQGIIDGLTAAWEWASTQAQYYWDLLVHYVKVAIAAIWGVIEPYVSQIVTALEQAWAFIAENTSAAWTWITETISMAWDYIYTLVSGWLTTITEYLSAGWTFITENVTAAWDAIWAFIESIWSAIYTTVSGWLDSASSYLSAGWDAIWAYVESVWNGIWEFIEGIWSTIYDTIAGWIDSAVSYLEEQWNYILETTSGILDEIWNYIEEVWTGIYDTVSGWIDDIVEYISGGWDDIMEGVTTFADGFWTAVKNAFGEAVQAGLNLLADLIDAIENVLYGLDVAPDVQAKLDSVSSTLRNVTGYAEGGVAFAKGGMGTPGPSDRIHLWNEQHGNEAYIAEKGPKRAQISYLQTAASWFDMGLVPQQEGGHSFSLGAYEAKGRSHAAFCNGGMAHGEGGYVSSSCSCGQKMDSNIGTFAQGGISTPVDSFYCGGRTWGPDIATIVQKIESSTGAVANTYSGHPGGEGNSADFWASPGCDAYIAPSTGDSVESMVTGEFGNQLDYYIWKGMIHGGWGSGPYEDPYDQHFDHLHATFGGEGGVQGGCRGGGKRAIAKRLINALIPNSMFETGFGLLGGDTVGAMGAYIDDPIVGKVVDYVVNKIAGCSGGGGASNGNCDACAQTAVDQFGWGEASCLASLGVSESTDCSNKYGPEGGAGGETPYGAFQMAPSTFAAYDTGCGDPSDCVCQGMASLNYQRQVWGEQKCQGPYAEGGITIPGFERGGRVPGRPGEEVAAVLHGGERVLPESLAQPVEMLAQTLRSGGVRVATSTQRATASGAAGVGVGDDEELVSILESLLKRAEEQTSTLLGATMDSSYQVMETLLVASANEVAQALANVQSLISSGAANAQQIVSSDMTNTQSVIAANTESSNRVTQNNSSESTQTRSEVQGVSQRVEQSGQGISNQVSMANENNVSAINDQTQKISQSQSEQTSSLQSSEASQTSEILSGQQAQTDDLQMILDDVMARVREKLAEKLGELNRQMGELPGTIKQSLGPLGEVGTKVDSLLSVTRQAWGLKAGGWVTRPTATILGEGNAPEAVVPIESRYRRKSLGLISELAEKFGLTLLDGQGSPMVGGDHRLVDGHMAREIAASGGGGASEIGWHRVLSGQVMSYQDNTGYGSLMAEAINRWNAAGTGAKILPKYSGTPDITLGMGSGDGWVGLAVSTGETLFDRGFVGGASANGILSLFGHELGHQKGLGHAAGTIMNSSVSASGGNVEYPTASDIARVGNIHGYARGAPRVPAFKRGGVIPGLMGMGQMIKAHAGERILTEQQNEVYESLLAAALDLKAGLGNGLSGAVGVEALSHELPPVNITVRQDFSNLTVGENISKEELEALAYNGGAQGAVDALKKVVGVRSTIGNRAAGGR